MSLPPHQNGLPFWCRLTQVVLKKRPLNGCGSNHSRKTRRCWARGVERTYRQTDGLNAALLWLKRRSSDSECYIPASVDVDGQLDVASHRFLEHWTVGVVVALGVQRQLALISTHRHLASDQTDHHNSLIAPSGECAAKSLNVVIVIIIKFLEWPKHVTELRLLQRPL